MLYINKARAVIGWNCKLDSEFTNVLDNAISVKGHYSLRVSLAPKARQQSPQARHRSPKAQDAPAMRRLQNDRRGEKK
jgi:hypothetical protein